MNENEQLPAIEFRETGFSFNFGEPNEVEVMPGVSYKVEDGEFVAIIGPSGCGKSTMLQLGAGLEFPTSGQVLWRGKPIEGPSPERGIIFQKPSLFPWCTALSATEWGLKMRGVPFAERRRVAKHMLADVGLMAFWNRKINDLSGGMQQRVAVAQVLANDCDLIFLDEPFSALDIQTRMLMQRFLLKTWQESSKTLVMVTHNIDEALMADRVIVLGRRPAKIIEDIKVNLPRPRDLRSSEFGEIHGHLSRLIEIEVMAAAKEEGSWESAASAAPVWVVGQ